MTRKDRQTATDVIERDAQTALDASGNNPPVAPATDVKPKEAKDARFVRLAPKRVNNAIKRLRQVAQLANPATYSYTEAQRDKIIAALAVEMQHLKDAFAGTKNGKGGFEL